MDKATVIAFLEYETACSPGLRWARGHKGPPAQMWAECPRYDWALWVVEGLLDELPCSPASEALARAWFETGITLAERFIVPAVPTGLRADAERLIAIHREDPDAIRIGTDEVERIYIKAHVRGNGRTDQLFRAFLYLDNPPSVAVVADRTPRLFVELSSVVQRSIPWSVVGPCLEEWRAVA